MSSSPASCLPFACQNPLYDKPSAKRLASKRALTVHLHSSKQCREYMIAALSSTDKKGIAGSKRKSIGAERCLLSFPQVEMALKPWSVIS
jgi:hypothetical protein